MDATEKVEQQTPLNVPHLDIVHFGQGFLRFVVCELRFPTLPDLDTARPPPSFHKALRRDYPHHAVAQTYGFGAGDPTQSRQHEFRSLKGEWIVTLRQDALVLQTTTYTSFGDFLAKLLPIISAAEPVIDAPFFTRVGLRYVNRVPLKADGTLEGLINGDLVGALNKGIYGHPTEHVGRVIGVTADGSYTFQHGFKVDEDFMRKPAYALDCDMSKENVALHEVAALLPKLNQYAYNLFHWALGNDARDTLIKKAKGS